MTSWTAVALRFATYVDLMLLFGMAAYGIYAARPVRPTHTVIFGMLAALGIALTAGGFLTNTAAMAGLPVSGLDRETLRMVLFETPVGTAAIVRAAALVVALAGVCLAPLKVRSLVVAFAAGSAVATLAWSGHGAMDDGTIGAVHLIADVVHLLAAATWLGALAILLRMAARSRADAAAVEETRVALAGFSVAGSVIVALVLVSGLVNSWIVVGPDGVGMLPTSLYGQLLMAKLLLFAAMLGLAAANRWRLTPRLAISLAVDDLPAAARALRTSIALEAGAAIVIVAVVAWLGTLAPPALDV